MGWLYTQNATRSDVINSLIATEENEHSVWKTHRHCTRGNVLWSIVEFTDKAKSVTKTFIACHLLQKAVDNYGHRKVTSWGYKSMDESAHPIYYSCPLSYLKAVPDVACQAWRDEVQKFHRQFQLGDRLMLKGCKIPYVDVVSVKPLRGQYQGSYYRISRNLVGAVVPANNVVQAA